LSNAESLRGAFTLPFPQFGRFCVQRCDERFVSLKRAMGAAFLAVLFARRDAAINGAAGGVYSPPAARGLGRIVMTASVLGPSKNRRGAKLLAAQQRVVYS